MSDREFCDQGNCWYVFVNGFRPFTPHFNLAHIKCFVCGKSYMEEDFVRGEDKIPSYYVGSPEHPMNAKKYYCSCDCGTKDNEETRNKE